MGISQLPLTNAVPLSFRNKIRNGDFSIAQRGEGAATVADNIVFIDGWTQYRSGGLSLSGTRNNFGASVSFPTRTYATYAMSGAISAAGDYAAFSQKIEDVRTMAGQKVTLSFNANASTSGRVVGIAVRQVFGTGGTPSANVDLPVQAVTLGTSLLTRYSVTFTVPSLSGKTIGNNEDSYLEIYFWMGAGTSYATMSALGAAATQAAWSIGIAMVQLEAGSAATSFEVLPLALQLAWCQRYYMRWTWPANDCGVAICNSYTNTASEFFLVLPVTLRTTPIPANVTFSAAGQFLLYSNGGVTPSTSISIPSAQQSPYSLEIDLAHAAVTVGGNLVRTTGAGRYLDVSVEF